MSGLLSDYNSIKNGSYGSLMKSYVNKVGNKNALNAYRETGSTTTVAEATGTGTTTKKSTASKSSFLDEHLKSIGKTESKSTDTKTSTAAESTSTTTADAATATATTDKYSKYKSSWLDNQLKQYDKDANKTTAADTSVSMDTTV